MTGLTLTTVLTILTVAGGYALLCLASPTRRCSRCGATGQLPGSIARRRRACPRCRGAGRRTRLGRRVYQRRHH